MYYILFIISGLFFIVIRKIYYYSVFDVRSKGLTTVFLILSVIASVLLNFVTVLFSGNYSLSKMIIMFAFNFVIDFLLSFFFSTKNVGYRFAMIICYETILALSECFAGGILFKFLLNPFQNNKVIEDSVVNILSAIISFQLIGLLSLFWKNKQQRVLFSQVLITCVTPFCSILFILFLPYQAFITSGRENHIFISFAILIILNFSNYYLIIHLLREKEMMDTVCIQDAQLSFQTKKYSQLSSSYKSLKRIIHEINHRDKYLASCMKNREYDKVESSLKEGIKNFESMYINNSSNNLVIDTFISSYKLTAIEKKITFRIDLKILKELIPISDQDLCIILGNLLDNSFNAAEKWYKKNQSYEGFYVDCQLKTQEKFFIIHISNPSVPYISSREKDNLNHGYGLRNVEDTVNRYNGFYHQEDDEILYSTTISIPINTYSI